MYCKNCGKQIDDNAYVCLNCGAIVGNVNGANEVTQRYCGNCGCKVDANASVCLKCGSRILPVINKRSGGMAVAIAIVSIIFSLLTAKFIGAVLAIAGLTVALSRKDYKGVRLNLIAMCVSALIAFVTIMASL